MHTIDGEFPIGQAPGIVGARAQPGLEVVKDEVRVRLRHGAQLRDVVPHHHVWKKKGMISCSSPKLFHFMKVCESFEDCHAGPKEHFATH